MKYNKKTFLFGISISFVSAVLITIGVIFGLQWMPKGSGFSFDTLGVFFGAVGSVGAIFAIWLTTRKQLNEQKEMQKQNVTISKEQNELQKKIVEISEEQKEIQKQNVKIALFEMRLEIYTSIREFISKIIQDNDCKNEDLQIYLRETREANLLFSVETANYINNLYKKATYLRLIKTKLKAKQSEQSKLIDEEFEIVEWFGKQFEQSAKEFDKYINVNKLGL